MYAVIKTGGKQYKVTEGEVLDIEKLDAEVGDEVEFEILFICDGSNIIIEPDELAKAVVKAEVVEHFKGKKQLVFKFKKRKNYKRLKGHRQLLTKVRFTLVATDGSAVVEKDEEPEVVEEAAPVEEAVEEAAEVVEEAAEEAAE